MIEETSGLSALGDLLEKAKGGGHRYIERTGTPGNYKYTYENAKGERVTVPSQGAVAKEEAKKPSKKAAPTAEEKKNAVALAEQFMNLKEGEGNSTDSKKIAAHHKTTPELVARAMKTLERAGYAKIETLGGEQFYNRTAQGVADGDRVRGKPTGEEESRIKKEQAEKDIAKYAQQYHIGTYAAARSKASLTDQLDGHGDAMRAANAAYNIARRAGETEKAGAWKQNYESEKAIVVRMEAEETKKREEVTIKANEKAISSARFLPKGSPLHTMDGLIQMPEGQSVPYEAIADRIADRLISIGVLETVKQPNGKYDLVRTGHAQIGSKKKATNEGRGADVIPITDAKKGAGVDHKAEAEAHGTKAGKAQADWRKLRADKGKKPNHPEVLLAGSTSQYHSAMQDHHMANDAAANAGSIDERNKHWEFASERKREADGHKADMGAVQESLDREAKGKQAAEQAAERKKMPQYKKDNQVSFLDSASDKGLTTVGHAARHLGITNKSAKRRLDHLVEQKLLKPADKHGEYLTAGGAWGTSGYDLAAGTAKGNKLVAALDAKLTGMSIEDVHTKGKIPMPGKKGKKGEGYTVTEVDTGAYGPDFKKSMSGMSELGDVLNQAGIQTHEADLMEKSMYDVKFADQLAGTPLEADALRWAKEVASCERERAEIRAKHKIPWAKRSTMDPVVLAKLDQKKAKELELAEKREDALDAVKSDIEEKYLDWRIAQAESTPMQKGMNELGDLLEKSGLPTHSVATLGHAKSATVDGGSADGGDLDGTGKTSGEGSAKPGPGLDAAGNVAGTPKGVKQKLSEDDEDPEKQMTEHKKPIETVTGMKKSLSPANQRELTAHESAIAVSRLRKGIPDVQMGAKPHPLSLSEVHGGDDAFAAGMLQASFYKGCAPSLAPANSILRKAHHCGNCGCDHSGLLTACPHCGDGMVKSQLTPIGGIMGGTGIILDNAQPLLCAPKPVADICLVGAPVTVED